MHSLGHGHLCLVQHAPWMTTKLSQFPQTDCAQIILLEHYFGLKLPLLPSVFYILLFSFLEHAHEHMKTIKLKECVLFLVSSIPMLVFVSSLSWSHLCNTHAHTQTETCTHQHTDAHILVQFINWLNMFLNWHCGSYRYLQTIISFGLVQDTR